MRKFNLRKKASSEDYSVTEKTIEKNRESMDLQTEKQGVVDKNINLSLPTKNKDATIPFNQQLDSARKNETSFAITEASMDKKEVAFGDKTEGVSPINALAEDLHQKKLEDYKKAEKDSKNDTSFWDKYVGVQLEEEKTTVSKNLPASASQLQNNPDRFKDKEIAKMVMASVKDADAMIFHIYAMAEKESRELTKEEEQEIVDITSGKIRLLEKISFFGEREEFNPILKTNEKTNMVEVLHKGKVIDEFTDHKEALVNYPEGEIANA